MANDTRETVKVVVADDSAIIRTGLVTLLRHMQGLRLQPFDVKTQDALRNYVQIQNPNVVIVNPMFNGLFDATAFRADNRERNLHLVALVSSLVTQGVTDGYDSSISILDNPEAIARVLHQVLDQHTHPAADEQEPLSQREREIIVCVVKGMTNKQIAEQLNLSIHTVITHRRNITHKLGIHSTAGLTIYAIVNKLVDLHDIDNQL